MELALHLGVLTVAIVCRALRVVCVPLGPRAPRETRFLNNKPKPDRNVLVRKIQEKKETPTWGTFMAYYQSFHSEEATDDGYS